MINDDRPRLLLAIDGPAGAGKSTAAAAVASSLKLAHLDTGAMYRALALAVIRAKADPTHVPAVEAVMASAAIELPGASHPAGKPSVFLNGENVTDLIRSAEVSATASKIATYPVVRAFMVARQLELIAQCSGKMVAEGRDVGTVVAPDAHLKVFLTAGAAERAERRAGSGEAAPESRADVIARDTRDATRLDSPLTAATDALVLDTTNINEDEVAQIIARRLEAILANSENE